MTNQTRESLEYQSRLSDMHIRNTQGVPVIVCVHSDEFDATWALPGGGITKSYQKAQKVAKKICSFVGEKW